MTPLSTRPRSEISLAGNRRDTPRIRAHLCTTMSANGFEMHASGTLVDLSIMGCQIEMESSCPIKKSALMEVRIHVPDLGWSIIIDEAVVQWIKGKLVGLCFVSVRVRNRGGPIGVGHCERR